MQRRLSRVPFAWAFLPYAAVAATHVVLLSMQAPAAETTKLLLMPALAVPVIASLRRVRAPAAIALTFAALLFSWLGDGVSILLPAAPEVPLMLLFFGVAHVAYILLFVREIPRRRMPWWSLVYAAWWVSMMIWLGPHTGGLFIAVAAYGLILGATAAFSSRCHPLVACGGALFLASDTLLAARLFLPDSLPAWSDPAIMLTYTIGQGFIIAGALITLRKKGE